MISSQFGGKCFSHPAMGQLTFRGIKGKDIPVGRCELVFRIGWDCCVLGSWLSPSHDFRLSEILCFGIEMGSN